MSKKIKKLNFSERTAFCLNVTAQRLCQLIAKKKTNLCLSADVTRASDLLHLADTVGKEIRVLKTHVDILTDFTAEFIQQLACLAQKHEFLLFEDRKFADIGSTVKQQYAGGVYRISDWADIINAHPIPGPGIIRGLQEIGLIKKRGLLLLAEMSSKGALVTEGYTKASLTMAARYPDFVIGFIAQHQLSKNPAWLTMTPGVKKECSDAEGLGQHYISPEQAIAEQGADIIIVGRGIYQADNPVISAQQYRKLAWETYLSCC